MSASSDDRGSVDDAAAICGCSVKAYRSYVSRQGAPKFVGYDPETGTQVFDLDAVRTWHASRPGAGARTDLRNV